LFITFYFSVNVANELFFKKKKIFFAHNKGSNSAFIAGDRCNLTDLIHWKVIFKIFFISLFVLNLVEFIYGLEVH